MSAHLAAAQIAMDKDGELQARPCPDSAITEAGAVAARHRGAPVLNVVPDDGVVGLGVVVLADVG